MSDNRKRMFTTILYPDAENYDYKEILEFVSVNYADYAYILHDRDVYPADIADSSTGEIIHGRGELKKPHIHLIFKFKDGRTVSAVAKELGLNDNDIEIIKSWKAQVRYLIHLDDEDKVRYNKDDIEANTPIEKFLQTEKEEPEQLREIVSFLRDKKVTNPYKLLEFVCDHPDLYPAYRRNAYTLNHCLSFNGQEIAKRKEAERDLYATEKHKQYALKGFTLVDDDEIDF